MDQGFIIFLLGVVIFICLMALFIVVHALFKGWVEEVKLHARDAAGRSLAIGFVNALLLTALSLGFWALGENSGAPVFAVVGLILMVALIIGMVFGLTAMVILVSERVFPEGRGWRQLAGGGSLLVLASLTPYIGWFGLFPYVVFRGLGGVIMTLAGAWRARRAARGKAGDG